MIQIYANRGHLIARIDPLGLTERPVPKVMAWITWASPKRTSIPSS